MNLFFTSQSTAVLTGQIIPPQEHIADSKYNVQLTTMTDSSRHILELDIGLKMGLGSNWGGHGVEVWVGV